MDRMLMVGVALLALGVSLESGAAAQSAPATDPPADPAAADQPAAAQEIPAPAGSRTFLPAEFTQFAPKTALDMVNQIPGFIIVVADQNNRGLGQATGNVLLNGQRVSGKTNDASVALARIDAASVIRIELADGASLNVPGLNGLVANVVYRASNFGGTFAWRPQLRPGIDDDWFNGEVSVNGKAGKTEWNASLSNASFRNGHWGPEYVYSPAGALLISREEKGTYYGDVPRLAASLSRTADNGNILNLNAAGALYYFTGRTTGDIFGPGTARSDELFINTEDEWNAEAGGDYELALGGGRLKFIGLHRLEHSPFSNRFTALNRAPGSVTTGNRFDQIVDERESVLRSEYRWKAGAADWQVSLEGAYNTLDSEARLFLRDATGQEFESPLPGGTALVTEKRGEAILTYGRPLGGGVTLQLNGGGEISQLAVSGPDIIGQRRTYLRPKGSVGIAWIVDPGLTVNAKVERRVDQLSFYDFLASVDVANDTSRGENPSLVPPQRWRAEIELNKSLGRWGSIKPLVAFALTEDSVESIPISPTREARGNIDTGYIFRAAMSGTLELAPLGWKGAKVDVYLQTFHPHIRDPLTGKWRYASGNTIWNWSADLRHDVSGTPYAWGLSSSDYYNSRNFTLTQFSQNGQSRPNLSIFAEHKNLGGLTARVSVFNLLGSRDTYNRTAYVFRRDGPVSFLEDRSRGYGRIVAFNISGKF